jgi:hypothetical protein
MDYKHRVNRDDDNGKASSPRQQNQRRGSTFQPVSPMAQRQAYTRRHATTEGRMEAQREQIGHLSLQRSPAVSREPVVQAKLEVGAPDVDIIDLSFEILVLSIAHERTKFPFCD